MEKHMPDSRSLSIRAAIVLSLLSLLIGGCTMAPVYDRPGAPTPDAYAQGAALLSRPVQDIAWRDFFKESTTRRLIELALANNRDLRIAMLNIEKTRALYRVQRADLLPTVAAAASADSQRIAAEWTRTGVSGITRQYSATLGFSGFELDLFGRIRSLTDQALETYYSVEEDAKTAQISLIAEVAGVYLQLIADREFLDITRATYKNRKGQYDLVSNKFHTGVASQLELSQARGIMEEARSNVARYSTKVGQDENYLALLLGAPVPKDMPELRKLSQVDMLADLREGLPSDLLERRPDVRAAEHRLKGANANIGVARANFFPRISLTGALGTLSAEAKDLFGPGNQFWQFLPSVSMPLFDTGRNIAVLQTSEAERAIAVAQYEKTVQAAFREVADTLVQREHIGEQLAAESSLLKSTSTSYALATARYEVGVDSYLNVLDAQRSLYSAQQSYINTKLLRETNSITLFKALGGGWK